MPIEDVFSIKGRGTVATGRIEQGIVKLNDEVEIVGLKDTQKSVVTGIEAFHKTLDQGQAGDNAGLLLRGIERDQIERGQVIAKPGSITPHTEFEAEVYILKKEEGGRHTPFSKGYKPQFYFRTTDVTGEVELPADKEIVMPGDTVTFKAKLLAPIAMNNNDRFAIREGGKTVGSGVITKIVKQWDYRIKYNTPEGYPQLLQRESRRSVIFILYFFIAFLWNLMYNIVINKINHQSLITHRHSI